ncbi:lycopene cyclase domain-containing protein [bacterium]|nr:lycopene cyclase domain-containing protein [bacterium]
MGIYFFNLPVEECLFFLTIPYALVFIYEVLNYYIKKDVLGNYGIRIAQYLGILNIIISLIFYDKSYTFVALLLNGIFLLLHSYLFRFKWLGRFFLAYLISLLPFFIVNGLLTSMPVVIYNDAENTGLRLFTIPIEDTMYSMLLFLVNITIYENLKMRWKKKNL